MMPQFGAALAFGFGAVAVGLVFGWAALRAGSSAVPPETVTPMGYRVRRIWLAVLILTGGAVFGLSLSHLPYPASRLAELPPGTSPQVIAVSGLQYGWQISPDTLPVGVPVRFDVTSTDVNHDFAIYDADDHLVGQVQAMPGFTNGLVLTFDRPGTYRVRCLELCGPLHFAMQRTVCVGSCG